ncbi:MAG TPA: hypothetical protein VNV15_08910 [Opitutaceae bacterium]|jgi:hypothetical protein|nr:hypothetical protein [Opitutaceae bacterium]
MAQTTKAYTGTPQGGGERRIWLIAGAGALSAMVLVLWLFSRSPAPPEAAGLSRPVPAVGLTRLDSGTTDVEVREQAELFDPTPLFLPTRWNVQPQGLPVGAARESGTAFAAFDPKLLFDKDTLALSFPAVVATPTRPVDALSVGTTPRPLLGLGRVDLATEPLAARGGFAEVSAAGTGEPVLAQALPGAAPPAGDWAPLEFLVGINAMGLVGPPQLMHSSGNEAVDGYFRAFLAGNFRLGARLRPGFFHVRIGP